MALDPGLKTMLDEAAEAGMPPLSSLTPAEARPLLLGLTALDGPPEEVAEVTSTTIPGPGGEIPLRVYRPAGVDTATPLPVLVWYHGGGFVLGDLDTADPTARKLANRAEVVVVSVDYRLAPEHPFPAAVDDARAAAEWARDHAAELGGRAGALAVGGDSAGGNLAAVVARELTSDLRAQLLVYPVIDARLDTPSMVENAEGYLLTADSMRSFWQHYLGDGDPLQPRATPLLAPTVPGVAPAIIVTAGFDPLRDEGDAYARRLADDGVAVVHLRYDDMIHGFATLATVTPRTDEMLTTCAQALRQLLA